MSSPIWLVKGSFQPQSSSTTGDSDLHGGFKLGGVVLSGALHQTQHQSLQRAGQRPLQGCDQILKRYRHKPMLKCLTRSKCPGNNNLVLKDLVVNDVAYSGLVIWTQTCFLKKKHFEPSWRVAHIRRRSLSAARSCVWSGCRWWSVRLHLQDSTNIISFSFQHSYSLFQSILMF